MPDEFSGLNDPIALKYLVTISGMELIMEQSEKVRCRHFNEAMLVLYQNGCRRIRAAIPYRPRRNDIDMEQYVVMGWPARA